MINYFLQVEKITTSKKPNLILNVDGVIAVSFVDLLRHSGCFTREEAQEYIEMGAINSLFVLGRSIGFIGKKPSLQCHHLCFDGLLVSICFL